MNPYGIWKICTEADVEGRGTQEIGIFEGNIRDILSNIGYKQYYNIFITRMIEDKKKLTLPPCPEHDWEHLNVYFEIPYKVSDFDTVLNSLFPISEKFYAKKTGMTSAIIYKGKDAVEQANRDFETKKEKALNKLTEEEKAILGLI